MGSVDRQQHALEVLKSVNKAVTNLRLYSEQSAQATNAVEKAYSELKSYLRLYQTLCFGLDNGLNNGLRDGLPTLDGIVFEKKAREQLGALTLVDSLARAGFERMTLSQGIDRKRFKQILSFFTATPEQINRAGGSASFVEQIDLATVFSTKSEAKGAEEQCDVGTFAGCYRKILAKGVRQSDILSLLHTGQGGLERQEIRDVLKDTATGGEVLAAGVCYVLQSLPREGALAISPEFSRMFDNIDAALSAEEARQITGGAAAWLMAHLGRESMPLLFCQHFAGTSETAFFSGLIAAVEKESFRFLVDFLKGEEERLAAFADQQQQREFGLLLRSTRQRLMETVKGRQLQALELMGVTEKQRQGKRLQTGLNTLAQGSLEGLKNKELLLHFGAAFERLMRNEKENVAAAIIQTLVGGLRLEEAELRHRCEQALAEIGEKLIILTRWGWLEKLSPTFLHWLRITDTVDDSWNRLAAILQRLLLHAQKTGKEELAEKILSLFYAIRSGALEKPEEARTQIGRVQDQVVDRDVLGRYLQQCFERPIEEMHCQKILMSGPLGIEFLLDMLLVNGKRSERIRLMRILVRVGASLTPLLLARLSKPMPWYGKRNLIRLLSATGEEKDSAAVHAYLSHEDLRVQGEALSCIQRLSEKKRKQELLDALFLVSEKLKFQAVRALASVMDEDVVGVLVELLQDEKYFSPDIKTTLLISICETLGLSGSLQALKALQVFIGKEGVRPKNMAEEVWMAARRGVEMLEASRREERHKDAEGGKEAVTAETLEPLISENSAGEYTMVTNLAEEREVYVLLGQNRMVAAKSLLLDLISTMSYLRRFEQAEALCRRLVEIDALALEEIVQATEIVEEQKALSVEQEQGMKWMDVYDFLTTEEFNCLYSILEHVIYTADENIVANGELQQLLFFINKGRAKLFYQDPQGNEILLKTVGTGEVLGGDSFFKASAWTVNAASVGTVDAFVLHREALRRCKNSCPELESKLETFCRQLGERDSLKVTAINRRRQKRFPFSAQLVMVLLDDSGRTTGTATTCEAIDISTGGIAFTIRIALKKNVRLLLGRPVHVSLPGGRPECQLTSGMTGVVVAIYAQGASKDASAAQGGYSMHIQFDQPMLEAELAILVSQN